MLPRIGVVGCGYWGKNLVRNFKQIGALSAVCEMTDAGLDTAMQIAPDARIFTKYKDLLESDVDGIVIATPAVTHHRLAKQALNAGKDVFSEKPLAINYEEGADLVKVAEEKNRMLMVGHVLEYHPAFLQLFKLINDGTLGRVQYIYSNRLSLGKIRREENILWSFAPHDIALILRIMGKMPFQVVACGGNYIQPHIADVTITNLLFDNSVRAHIHVSWLHPFKEQRLVVIGSEKMASFDDVSKKLLLYDQRVELREGEPIPVRGEGDEVNYPDEEPLKNECVAFVEAIQTRKPPLTDGKSGLDVLKVLQAAQRSLIMNGEQVTIPENGQLVTGTRHSNNQDKVTVVDESVLSKQNGKTKKVGAVHD